MPRRISERVPHYDDLPIRDQNSRIQDQSEAAFQAAVSDCEEFVVQSEDRRDYGTDYQIEATDAGRMTNVRVHVQLKGTGCRPNTDGSISLSINRRNLNYLAMQTGSIFVCYHVDSDRLLVRRVDDVVCEYENKNNRTWACQSTVTVRFSDTLDRDVQHRLKNYVIASAKSARDRRLQFATQPPEVIPDLIDHGEADLPIPPGRKQAEDVLVKLFESNRDNAISRSFNKFVAILGPSNNKLVFAYMAEINLGINGHDCCRSRIAEGIRVIQNSATDGGLSRGVIHYNVGNGWYALNDYGKARQSYDSAMDCLVREGATAIAARCCKNLGATMEKLKEPELAHEWYTRSLGFDPHLPEAHFALALWYNRMGTQLDQALIHLDAIVWPSESAGTVSPVLGWRAEILLGQRRTEEGFREIHNLLSQDEKPGWIWPWCARLVATYGGDNIGASIRFWEIYLKDYAGDIEAQRERLLCVWLAHAEGKEIGWNYRRFRKSVADIAEFDVINPEFLWDRAGHWAQDEGEWTEAEVCYRRAFDLSLGEYGYCLGVALNFLNRYEEALPILVEQAETHQPDAMSWFQVAIAREGTGDVRGCIDAYNRTLDLDEDYALAWFNIGGVYCNTGDEAGAISTWKEAIRRFPDHELAKKLLADLPILRS